MHALLEQLDAYLDTYPKEQGMVNLFKHFIANHPDGFERSCAAGHFTASSWLVNHQQDAFVLLHHKKINKWIQPGGHADGHQDLLAVAKKEACEETGFHAIAPLSAVPLHIAVYGIASHKRTPSHLHYDVCFGFKLPYEQALVANDEASAIAWFQTPTTQELSIQIIFEKWLNQKQQHLP